MKKNSILYGLKPKDKGIILEVISSIYEDEAKEVSTLGEFKEQLQKEKVDVVFVSQECFPLETNGDFLTETKIQHPYLSFVIIGERDIEVVVNYIKKGA